MRILTLCPSCVRYRRMTQPLASAQSRSPTRRDPLARYRPRAFSQASRWRFVRDRRGLYLGQIRGELREAQKALIDTLVELEWGALRAESEGGITAYREGRELRRLFLRAVGDFQKSLVVAPPPAPSLAEVIARHRDKAA
jgi:hypothetical protein